MKIIHEAKFGEIKMIEKFFEFIDYIFDDLIYELNKGDNKYPIPWYNQFVGMIINTIIFFAERLLRLTTIRQDTIWDKFLFGIRSVLWFIANTIHDFWYHDFWYSKKVYNE